MSKNKERHKNIVYTFSEFHAHGMGLGECKPIKCLYLFFLCDVVNYSNTDPFTFLSYLTIMVQ